MSKQTEQPAEEPHGGEDRPVLDYSSGLQEEMVRIARFHEGLVAELAAGKLENAGISCRVERSFQVELAYRHTAALLVSRRDVDRAIEVLAQTPARAHLLIDPSRLPPIPVAAPVVCAHCGSAEKKRKSRRLIAASGLIVASPALLMGEGGWIGYACFAPIWLVLVLFDRPWLCAACGRPWAEKDDEPPDEPSDGAV